MEITSLKAWEMKDKLFKKELSSREIIEAHIKKIDENEPQINAFITLDKENALKEANRIDEKIARGERLEVLAGLPIGIKDNIVTKNLRTTCASRMLADFIPPYDATVIENIRKNDGIIIGKNNLDEFAMGASTESSYFGKTRNPINLNLVPGGSSGGSAAAVAAHEVPLSLGTDTGGSVRQPASFCGVVGIKPTYGVVSRYGVVPMANTLDQVGSFGRDIRDAVLMLNAIKGYDRRDSTSSQKVIPAYLIDNDNSNDLRFLKGMKIALPKEYEEFKPANKDIQDLFEKSLKIFEDNGAKIDYISLPHLKYALETYYIIMTSEVSSNLARYDGIRYGHRAEKYETLTELYTNSRTEGFGEEVKRRIMTGTYSLSASFTEDHYKKALKVRTLIKQDYDKAYADHDIILSLVSPVLPFEFDSMIKDPVELYKADLYTVPVNIAGLCSLSLPMGRVDGLPVGLQITGDRFMEEKIIKAGLGFERAVL